MAGCSAERFEGVGPEVYACLKAKGEAAGVPFGGNEGQATTMGVTVRWNYDPAAKVLVLECTDAPRFVPCSAITKRLRDLVDGCRAKAS